MAKAKAKDYLNEVRVIESERTDGLPLVAFAYSEGVRRKAELRSPQRGKEDAQPEANKRKATDCHG